MCIVSSVKCVSVVMLIYESKKVSLARSLLQQQGVSGCRWQFQIMQVPPLETPSESMTILVSPELQA